MYPGTTGTIYYYLSVCIPFNTLTIHSHASLFRFLRHFPRLLIRVRAFQTRLKISSLVHLSLQHVHRQKVSRLFAVSDAFLDLLFIGRVFLFESNATGFRPETRPTLSHRRQRVARARGGVPGRAFDHPVFASVTPPPPPPPTPGDIVCVCVCCSR